MATLLSYLGVGSKPAVPEEPAPVRALPASWYNSKEMYELERRAIFSKKWMLITHKMRLAKPGDWLKFHVAGYEFVLCLDRKGSINGFHNICRHRAFPVVQGGTQGNAKIFSCRYHGWSYGLDGKLAKAPQYDKLTDFDKTQNGMFPIHVKIDVNGFIWVNLDASDNPEPWEAEFEKSDVQERFSQFNFDDYVFDHGYQMDGPYNWKILADNFNECYHCPTSHPTIGALADITTHDIQGYKAYIQHQSQPTEENEKNGVAIASTYYFPNVSVSVLKNYIMLQRFLPLSPNSSVMEYQIFRNIHSTPQDFTFISDLYAQIVSEDKILCELAQRNLDAGIFVNGQLHPKLEKGPLYFQAVNRRVIREHVALEKKLGREVWPARQQKMSSGNKGGKEEWEEDEMLCMGLCEKGDKKIDW